MMVVMMESGRKTNLSILDQAFPALMQMTI